MKNLFGFFFSTFEDGASYQETVDKQVNSVNATRSTFVMGLGFILVLLLIVLVDVPYVLSNGFEMRVLDLFIVHAGLFAALFVGFIFAVREKKKLKQEDYLNTSYELVTLIIPMVLLAFIAIMNGLGQRESTSITTYVILVLVISILVLLKPKKLLLLYAGPHALFIILQIVFQDDTEVMANHIVYGTIAVLFAIFVGSIFYRSFWEITVNKIVLDDTVRRLELRTHIDELTNIYNRSFGMRRLYEEFTRSIRSGEALGIIMFDIDYFRKVNEKYGLAAGDQVLKEIADRIQKITRASDILARYGGEEFLLITPKSTNKELVTIAEKIRKEIDKTKFKIDGDKVSITISVGGTSYPETSKESIDELVKHTDENLRYAKESGRNQAKIL